MKMNNVKMKMKTENEEMIKRKIKMVHENGNDKLKNKKATWVNCLFDLVS